MSRVGESVHDPDPEVEYDEFVTGAWRRLCWTAYMLTGDRGLAEDLVQTALVKTYVAWKRVRRDDALAYTRKILVNANVDRLRRRHLTELPGLLREPVAAAQNVIEDRDEIVRLLAGLTGLERKVMVLRYYFDLSESDTADELGVGVGTEKSTAARARTKLRSGTGRASAGGHDGRHGARGCAVGLMRGVS
jgi:RNA polymerase sigma-70 factor (sigma-E family)